MLRLGFMSCIGDAEDTCLASLITKNLIGSWDVLASDMSQPSTVSFRSDGTGTNDTNTGPLLYFCHQNDEEVKDFTWRLDTLASTGYIFLKYRNTNFIQDNAHLVLLNECGRIDLSIGLETIIMTRG